MKEKTIQIFEDGDAELLKKRMPEDPCEKCGSRYSSDCTCSECKKPDSYRETMAQFKQKNLYDMGLKIKKRDSLAADIREKQAQLKEIDESLPDFVLGNDNPFRTYYYQKSLRSSGTITGNEFSFVMSEGGEQYVKLAEIKELIEAGALVVDYDVLEDYIFSKKD